MAASNINRVVLTGNLTADPDLRASNTGMPICKLRIAVNTTRKDGASGEWVEKPNFFNVTVFGKNGENCAKFLSKGRPVAIDGRLEWSEWDDRETGKKRQSVDIVADNVQFLGSAQREDNGGGFTPRSDVPTNTDDFAPAPAPVGGGAPTADDDIPF